MQAEPMRNLDLMSPPPPRLLVLMRSGSSSMLLQSRPAQFLLNAVTVAMCCRKPTCCIYNLDGEIRHHGSVKAIISYKPFLRPSMTNRTDCCDCGSSHPM